MSVASEEATSLCSHCDRAIPSANIDLHFAHCSRNLEKCKVCADMVPIKHAEEHYFMEFVKSKFLASNKRVFSAPVVTLNNNISSLPCSQLSAASFEEDYFKLDMSAYIYSRQ